MPLDRARLLRALSRSGGKESLARVLLHTRVEEISPEGLVLDLGSSRGLNPSYYHHFRSIDRSRVITVDIVPEKQPHLIANLEMGLPFKDSSVDCVIMFNFLEHMYDSRRLCADVYRVLQPQGKCYVFVPFLHRIHDDPGDYFRYSDSALRRMLLEAGFHHVEAEPLGFGPITTAWAFLAQVAPLKPLHAAVFRLAFRLDDILARRNRHLDLGRIYPIGYFATAVK